MLFCQMSMKIFSFHYLITVDRWILKAGAASKVQAVESDKSFAAVFSLAPTPPHFLLFVPPHFITQFSFQGTIEDLHVRSEREMTSAMFPVQLKGQQSQKLRCLCVPGLSFDGGRVIRSRNV